MTTVTRAERVGGLFLLCTCVIEGLTPIIAHRAAGLFPPILFLAVCSTTAAVILFIILIAQGIRWSSIPRRPAASMGIVGLIVFTGFAMIFIGTSHTSGINTALLTQMEMPFALLLSTVFFGERVRRRQWIGALVVFAGTVLILYNGSFALNAGDLLIVASTVLFPFANTIARKALTVLSPFVALFIRYVCVVPVLFLVSALFERGWWSAAQPFSGEQWWLIAVYSTLVLIGSKTTWYEGLRRVPLGTATAIISAFPVFSILFAFLLLHEVPTVYQLMGGILALAGVCILVRPGFPPTPDLV